MPIIAENGSKSLIINTLLDDGSTQTDQNADTAAKFGLQHEVALKMVEKSIKYDGNSTPDLKKHEVQQWQKT